MDQLRKSQLIWVLNFRSALESNDWKL
jgi:hypothetical protein